jgi:hypothetical protein
MHALPGHDAEMLGCLQISNEEIGNGFAEIVEALFASAIHEADNGDRHSLDRLCLEHQKPDEDKQYYQYPDRQPWNEKSLSLLLFAPPCLCSDWSIGAFNKREMLGESNFALYKWYNYLQVAKD